MTDAKPCTSALCGKPIKGNGFTGPSFGLTIRQSPQWGDGTP